MKRKQRPDILGCECDAVDAARLARVQHLGLAASLISERKSRARPAVRYVAGRALRDHAAAQACTLPKRHARMQAWADYLDVLRLR